MDSLRLLKTDMKTRHLGAGGRNYKYLMINEQEFLTHTVHFLSISVMVGCENSQLETRFSKNIDYCSLFYNR